MKGIDRQVAAVGAGDDALFAEDVGVADEALRDNFRMLDVVGARCDHAGDEDFIVREFDFGPGFPLVLVTWIRAFDEQRHRLHFDRDRKYLHAIHVIDVRALVVAPADVQADAVRGNVGERVIQRLDLHFGVAQEFGITERFETRVASHGEIGAIELQQKT